MPPNTGASRDLGSNPYQVLGLAKTARPEDVKAAYFSLVRQYSPERFPAEFQQIRKAYVTLKDPEKRAALDVTLVNPIPEPITYDSLSVPATDLDDLTRRVAEEQRTGRVNLDLYRRRSLFYVELERWDEAHSDWETILKQAPGDEQTARNVFLTHFLRGNLCAENNDFAEAMKHWRKAYNLDGNCEPLIHNLAIGATMTNSHREEATYWRRMIEAWQRELAKQPSDRYLRALTVEAHRLLGGEARVIEEMEAPHEAVPEHALQDAESCKKMGMECMNKKNWRGAVLALTRALEEHPDDIDALNSIGWAYLNLREEQRAFSAWSRALRLDPNNTVTRRNIVLGRENLAKHLKSQGLLKPASVHLKHILQVDPKNAKARLELADTYYKLGDITSALREWETLLKYDPHNRQAIQRIREVKARHHIR